MTCLLAAAAASSRGNIVLPSCPSMPFSVGIRYEIKDANDQMHNLFLSIIVSAKQIHLCCTFLSDIIYSAVVAGCNTTKMAILRTRPKKRNLINFFFCTGNGFSFLVRTQFNQGAGWQKKKRKLRKLKNLLSTTTRSLQLFFKNRLWMRFLKMGIVIEPFPPCNVSSSAAHHEPNWMLAYYGNDICEKLFSWVFLWKVTHIFSSPFAISTVGYCCSVVHFFLSIQ